MSIFPIHTTLIIHIAIALLLPGALLFILNLFWTLLNNSSLIIAGHSVSIVDIRIALFGVRV